MKWPISSPVLWENTGKAKPYKATRLLQNANISFRNFPVVDIWILEPGLHGEGTERHLSVDTRLSTAQMPC